MSYIKTIHLIFLEMKREDIESSQTLGGIKGASNQLP